MRKYRRLMMSCVNASSMSDAPDAMMASAANCPAEVTFRAESTEASNTESPDACGLNAKRERNGKVPEANGHAIFESA